MDPTAGSIINLIGSLGSAGAAVVVVWFFLSYLKSEGDKRDQRYEELVDRHAETIRDNSLALREFIRGCNQAQRGNG